MNPPLKKKPALKKESYPGQEELRPTDSNLASYFTARSRRGDNLIIQPVAAREAAFEITEDEIREEDIHKLTDKLQTAFRGKERQRMLSDDLQQHAPFVYRANFNLSHMLSPESKLDAPEN